MVGERAIVTDLAIDSDTLQSFALYKMFPTPYSCLRTPAG
jgi:hypothetical protein